MKLLHFTASWCKPSKEMMPMVNEVIGDFPSLNYLEIDVESNQQLAKEYGVKSVPTFILEDLDGGIIGSIGESSKDEFIAALFPEMMNG